MYVPVCGACTLAVYSTVENTHNLPIIVIGSDASVPTASLGNNFLASILIFYFLQLFITCFIIQ